MGFADLGIWGSRQAKTWELWLSLLGSSSGTQRKVTRMRQAYLQVTETQFRVQGGN